MTNNILPSFFDRLLNSITNGTMTVAIRETAVDRYYQAIYSNALECFVIEHWDGVPVTIRRTDSAAAMTRAMARPPWMTQ